MDIETKFRRAIIRERAKEVFRAYKENEEDYNEHPWKFVALYEQVMDEVCRTESERCYFDDILLWGSERAAKHVNAFLEGVIAGLKAKRLEESYPKA